MQPNQVRSRGSVRDRATRKIRAASACASLAVLIATGCHRQEAAGAPTLARSFAPIDLLEVEPTRLPEAVRERYRLGLDRRLLTALAEVARQSDGADHAQASARFENDRWQIEAGGETLGDLSALPDFEEATDLLVRHARRLVAPTNRSGGRPARASDEADLETLRKAIDGADSKAILDALRALDSSAPIANLDADSLRALVAGVAWLSFLTPDELEQSDPLLATAWAWLALERALDIRGNDASEVLVAWALGYEAAAARSSGALPADDPIRLFVAGKETALAAACARNPRNAPANFLRLAWLAERELIERYRAAQLESPFVGPERLTLLGLEARLRDFERGPSAGRELARAAFREARTCAGEEPERGPSGVEAVEARIRELEAAAPRCAASFRGTALGAAAVEAHFRSAFYSGLFGEARFLLRQLSSGPAALAFARELGETPAGAASDLRRWLEVSGTVSSGTPEALPVVELLESDGSLGSAILEDLSSTLATHTESTAPLRRRPMPALFARLDSRPRHRVVAARVARRILNSSWLFETLARSAVEVAPHRSEELPALVAQLREEVGKLREIADDPAMPSYARIVAVDALSRLGSADDAFVRARYEEFALDPDGGVAALVGFFERRGDFAGAYDAVTAALERARDADALHQAYLRSEAARLKLLMGDEEAAWRLVEPALRTGMEHALLVGADVLLARGRIGPARDLARSCLERYPESAEASALLARAGWRLGEHVTAAQELAASRNRIVGSWNRFLPEAFAATFAAAPAVEVERAFDEMIAAGIAPHVLADVAVGLGRKGALETALALIERLPRMAPEWKRKIGLDVYDLVRERSGEEAAIAWYRARYTRTHDDALSLYQLRRYEQLLALFPNGDESQSPNIVRVLKAAALHHLRETAGPRWSELASEVKGDWGREDFFVRAARFLLDQADQEAVLGSIPDVGHLASIGWAMGVKAASEGRFVVADGWFQVALESGQAQQPPHAWSWQIESDWMMTHRSLELLEQAGSF